MHTAATFVSMPAIAGRKFDLAEHQADISPIGNMIAIGEGRCLFLPKKSAENFAVGSDYPMPVGRPIASSHGKIACEGDAAGNYA